MANFAIMRAKKLVGMGSVASSLQHCFRERETPNADQELTPENEHLAYNGKRIDSSDSAMGRLRERLPEKRRKDAVLAIEYVMTASPAWWEQASPDQQQEFFRRSVAWLSDKYGAENIVAATVHRDEMTPHLSAFVVPRTQDGRLTAKEFIGNRTKMSQDQTSYAERVADLGLERGIEGSRAKHQAVRAFYGAMERGQVPSLTITPANIAPQVLKKGIFTSTRETPEMIAERLTKGIKKAYQPAVDMARMSAQERRRAKELQDTALQQQKRLKVAQEPFKGLSREQQAKLLQQAEEMRHQNELQRHDRTRGRGR